MRVARSSPLAHRSARVIGTDALDILLVSPEPSDGEEHKQDTKDDPNINAHQSSTPAPFVPADTQRAKEKPQSCRGFKDQQGVECSLDAPILSPRHINAVIDRIGIRRSGFMERGAPGRIYSCLMFAARTTLPHFSVYWTM